MSAIPSPAPERPAVVLLNFGGPRTLEDVEPFLFEILRDPNTIQLPVPQWLQDALARRIARRRSRVVAAQYDLIGGGSPIVAATDAIARALAAALERAGEPLPVYCAHRYLPGHTAATAAELVAAGVDDLLALPLYPHFSYATTGSSFQQLRQALRRAGYRGRLRVLRSYPDAPGYLDALAEKLQACLFRERPNPAETVILCSAHGLPASYVERGDPYRLELYRTLEGMQRRFGEWRFVLSFQSRVGPAEWLKPYTDQIIPELAAEGVRHLVFLPLSFVNDHLETLYEIDHLYCEQARRQGMVPVRVNAIEEEPRFIEVLSDYALAWRKGQAGFPVAELLPPDQSFARVGRWVWAAWAAALFAVLLLALGR